MTSKYDDIINLPHHVSSTRPQMPLRDRAAQFSAFAALTGYEEAVRETARQTDGRICLADNEIEIQEGHLQWIAEHLAEQPEVEITYFRPDERKAGGAYVRAVGRVRQLDRIAHVVAMQDGQKIPISDIIDIQTEA